MGTLFAIVTWPVRVLDDALGWLVFDVLFHRRRALVVWPLLLGGPVYVVYGPTEPAPRAEPPGHVAVVAAPTTPVTTVVAPPPAPPSTAPVPPPPPSAAAATPAPRLPPAAILEYWRTGTNTRLLCESAFAVLARTDVDRDTLMRSVERRCGPDDAAREAALTVLARGGLDVTTPPGGPEVHALGIETRRRFVTILCRRGGADAEVRALDLMLPGLPPIRSPEPCLPDDVPSPPPDPDFLAQVGVLSRSPHRAVRERCAQWLACLQPRTALPFIRTLCKDPDGAVRVAAAVALAAHGETGGTDVVAEALQDASPIVRARALAAVPALSRAATTTQLQQTLLDGNPAVHCAAAVALLAMDSLDGLWVLRDDLLSTDRRTRDLARAFLEQLPLGTAVEPCRQLLKTAEVPASLKLVCCRVVGARGGPGAVDLARALLGKRSVDVRRSVLAGLTPAMAAEMVDALIPFCTADEAAMRRRAVRFVGPSGPADLCRRLLDDPDETVRDEALRAWGRRTDAGAATTPTLATTAEQAWWAVAELMPGDAFLERLRAIDDAAD